MYSQQQKIKPILPFKSVGVALLFCAVLGPVGVLYASLFGGITMIILGFIVLSTKLLVPSILLWLISCIWGVAATNRYNNKILHELLVDSASQNSTN